MRHLSTLVLSILSALAVNSAFAQCPIGGCSGGGYGRGYHGSNHYGGTDNSDHRNQFDDGRSYRSPNDGYDPYTQGHYQNPSYGYSQGGYSAPSQGNRYEDRPSTWSNQGSPQSRYVPVQPSANENVQRTGNPNPNGYAQRNQGSGGFTQSEFNSQSNAVYYPVTPQNSASTARMGTSAQSPSSIQSNR